MFDYSNYLNEYRQTGKNVKHIVGFVMLISILNTKSNDIRLVYDEFKLALDYPDEVMEFIIWMEKNDRIVLEN